MSFKSSLKAFFVSYKTRFWYGCFGVFFGLSIFFYFWLAVSPSNWAAAGWGLASAMYAFGFIIVIRWRMKRDEAEEEYYVSDKWAIPFYVLGTAGTFAGLAAMSAYLAFGAINHEAPTEQSDWVSSVWAFMTAKWALGFTVNIRPLFAGHYTPPRNVQYV